MRERRQPSSNNAHTNDRPPLPQHTSFDGSQRQDSPISEDDDDEDVEGEWAMSDRAQSTRDVVDLDPDVRDRLLGAYFTHIHVSSHSRSKYQI